MAHSILSTNPLSLHLSSLYSSCPRFSLSRQSVEISASAQGRRLQVLRAMQPSGPGGALPSQGDAKATNSDAGSNPPKGPNLPNFPLNNIPPWAKWVLGSVVLVALPFYKKILRIEDEVEKEAETVTEVVEKVAVVVEKVAEDVEEALPGNGKLKEVALEVEQIAEVVVKDAEVAETLIQKVDMVVEEVDTVMEPIIEEEENTVKRGPPKVVTSPITDSKKAM